MSSAYVIPLTASTSPPIHHASLSLRSFIYSYANTSSVPFQLLAERKKDTELWAEKRTVAASHSPLREFSHKTRAKIPTEFLYTVATLLTANKSPQFSSTNFSRYSSCSLSPVDPDRGVECIPAGAILSGGTWSGLISSCFDPLLV